MTMRDLVLKVRSTDAGPFWVTIDVFCDGTDVCERLTRTLRTVAGARLFQVAPDQLTRFDIPDLGVIKFSLARPVVQASAANRDMHRAQYAALLEEMPV